MDRKEHLSGFRLISQSLVLVADPQQLCLAVSPTDVHAQLDQLCIDRVIKSVRGRLVRGALDRDRSLIIGFARGAPGALSLIDDQSNPPVAPDRIVARRLFARLREHASKGFDRQLANHAVRRDAVDRMCPLPGIVRAQFRILYQ